MRDTNQKCLPKLALVTVLTFLYITTASFSAFAKPNDEKSDKKNSKSPEAPKAELIADWPFNEGAGLVTRDLTPPPQPGLIIKAKWEKATACAVGSSCLSFNGTDSFVHILGKPHFKADALSVSAWIYSDNFCKEADCRSVIMEKSKLFQDFQDEDDYLSLETVKIGNNVYPRFRLKIKGKLVTVTGNMDEANGRLNTNLWTHLIAVYDGKNLILYKNGIRVGSTAATGSLYNHGSGALRIGASADISPHDFFFGKIDNVQLYRGALSLNEILELIGQGPSNLFCGDKVVNNTEECDGSTLTSCSANGYQGVKECSATCKYNDCQFLEYCGDGKVQSAANETCDDGNTANGDGCSATCIKEFCGDATVQTSLGEDCDDGNTTNNDDCSNTCKRGYCGDSVTQSSLNEACDNNTISCQTLAGYTGSQHCQSNCSGFDSCQSALFCGDGICTAGPETIANCLIDCPAICGDGSVNGPEVCDDGNNQNNDGCDQSCNREYCGDGVIQVALGEECDDHNGNDTDLCTNQCTQNMCSVDDQLFVPVKLSTAPVCNGTFVASNGGVVAWLTKAGSQCDVILNTANSNERVTATSTNEHLLSVNDQGWVAWDNENVQLGKKIYYYRDAMTFEVDNTLFGNQYPLTSGRYDNTGVQLGSNHTGVWLSRNPDVTGYPFDVVKYNFDNQVMERITENDFNDEQLRINTFGSFVWQGKAGNADSEIFYHNGVGIQQLTNNTTEDINPMINDNGWIVWQGFDGNDYEIYVFDGTAITTVTENDFNDVLPQINNKNEIVWIGALNTKNSLNGANEEVFMYDQGFVHQLTDNDVQDSSVQINNTGIVIWIGHPSVNTPESQELYLNVQGHTYQLTNDVIADLNPKIGNNMIYWIKGNNPAALDMMRAHLPVTCTAN